MHSLDELTLATRAGEGDSACADELRQRVLRCAVTVVRQMRWSDALDKGELEQDVPNEVVLRLIARVRRGFTGEVTQFRTYLYRVVTSVTADAVRLNLDRRHEVSLDAPFEYADGSASTLRDFIENHARMGRCDELSESPESASIENERYKELVRALDGLDDWCRTIVNEAVINERPHALIASDHHVTVPLFDVSLKRCLERLYRNLLMAYATGTDKVRRKEVADLAEQLPEPLRKVFLLWWNQNQSVKAIATECGITTDEAKRLLARAKASMWALMD